MKKIRFYLKKSGVSMREGGVIKHDFVYDYSLDMTVNNLVDLCRKIYEDVKTAIAENNSTEKFEVVFNYLVHTDDVCMCDFVTGWLNGTDEGDEGILTACVLRERLSKSKVQI